MENKMTHLPCCRFPTSALLIDDNEYFLSSLSLLINRHIPTKIETNPHNAIDFIKNNYLKLSNSAK